jgi:hypothetical protein
VGQDADGAVVSVTSAQRKRAKIDEHFSADNLHVNNVLEKFHKLQVRFARNNNVAFRAITSKDCPEFNDVLLYQHRFMNVLKNVKETDLLVGRFKAVRIMTDTFEFLLAAVDRNVTETRDYWKTYTGSRQKFVTVCFDGWDSKRKDLVGVTVDFYNPVNSRILKVGVGLMATQSKKANDVASDILQCLERVGIEKEDLYRTVNDTTNSAIKTGWNLTGKKGTCAMHRTNLIIEHATGRKTRKQGKKVTDEFNECEEIRKETFEFGSYYNNNRRKQVYLALQRWCAERKISVCRIALPNATRAAGTALMYRSIIRQRWVFREYWHATRDPGRKKLTDSGFKVIAQLESVLYPVSNLVKQVQTDSFGSMSYTFLHVFPCLVDYLLTNFWYVASVDLVDHQDNSTWWHGGARFPERSEWGMPLASEKDPAKYVGKNVVHFTKVTTNELEEVPKRLIERIQREFKKYGGIPTEDQLLAMACNPLSATTGFQLLQMRQATLEESEMDCDTHLMEDFRTKAKNLLEAAINEKCYNMIYGGSDETNVATLPVPINLCDDQEHPMRRQLRLLSQKSSTVKQNRGKQVKEEIEKFFGATHDWPKIFAGQELDVPTIKSIGPVGDDVSAILNWGKIARHFNLMKWWEEYKVQYPFIYVIACHILPTPDSNGNQERTFSAATWMDGKLNNRQSDATFQMKVLCYKNSDFIDSYNTELEDKFKTKARKASLAAMKSSIATRRKEADELDKQKREELKKTESNMDWEVHSSSSMESNCDVSEVTVASIEDFVEAKTFDDNDDEKLLNEYLNASKYNK